MLEFSTPHILLFYIIRKSSWKWQLDRDILQNVMFFLKTSQFKLLLFILFCVTCDTVEVSWIILESRNHNEKSFDKGQGKQAGGVPLWEVSRLHHRHICHTSRSLLITECLGWFCGSILKTPAAHFHWCAVIFIYRWRAKQTGCNYPKRKLWMN